MFDVNEFFKNLPDKNCHQCGEIIVEKADCYGNLCDECDNPAR